MDHTIFGSHPPSGQVSIEGTFKRALVRPLELQFEFFPQAPPYESKDSLEETHLQPDPFERAMERPLERPFESNGWASPYEDKVYSLEDLQPDSIAGVANGRKKLFWQRITRKFAS